MRDLNFEFRDSLRQCDPDDIRIDFEISVHQVMPHADNAAPRVRNSTDNRLHASPMICRRLTIHACVRSSASKASRELG